MRTHHKFRKIRSYLRQNVRTSAFEEPLPPCSQNVRSGQIPSLGLTADVFYGHLLIAYNKTYKMKTNLRSKNSIYLYRLH